MRRSSLRTFLYSFMILIGILFIISSMCMFLQNLRDEYSAAQEIKASLTYLSTTQEKPDFSESILTIFQPSPVPENIDNALTTVGCSQSKEAGSLYLGTLNINKLHLTLPVFHTLTDSNLKSAPCRYEGSVDDNSVIIAGHNYQSHFGLLKNLTPGDEIQFIDTSGNEHNYIVTKIEILRRTDIEPMKSGNWDMTLFTCTSDGFSRVTVRCTRLV